MKLWLRVHKWSSLAATLLLLVLCITGLPLIFSDELTAGVRLTAAEVTPSTPSPLDDIVARVMRQAPGRFVQFVFWQQDQPGLVGLGLASQVDAPLDDVTRVLVDATNGEARGDVPSTPRALEVLLELHKNLYLGQLGDVMFALVAALFLISTVSGVVVYGPFMRHLDFGSVRTRSARLKWLDLHNLVGVATGLWALVVGATGLMNTLEGPLFGAWQAAELPALLATPASANAGARESSLARALESARRALPNMQPTSIGLAGTRYGTPRHHLVWMHGTSTLTQRLFTPVLVERATAQVALAKPLPWYLRLLELSRPLHFGDYGGLPLKLIWAALDLLLIFVLGSGVYLWVARWRNVRPIALGDAAESSVARP